MSTTTEWAAAPEHPGYITKTVKKGNVTIEIFRPELDQTERAKTERQIKTTLERSLSAYYYRKEEKSCKTTSQ